ncbi:MAG: peroxiredoxin [Fibrobacteres bacterium]|nr:peroxiredoxin [Fibrobacterota bacterium]
MRAKFSAPSIALAFALALAFLPHSAHAAKDSIAVGQPAPDFTLPDQDGKPVGPKDFSGHWLVLYFYPKDFTGGCTLEAHNFQRDSAKYAEDDAAILGVSLDTPGSHKDFCAKEGLRFKLLADSGGTVSARYGSLNNYLGKKLSARNTFIIDSQGKVARVFLGVKPATHSEEVLAALAELRKPK